MKRGKVRCQKCKQRRYRIPPLELSDYDRQEILRLHDEGLDLKEVAKLFRIRYMDAVHAINKARGLA